MCDKEIWKFINSFAPWLSGIGAMLAVIVSLYLTRRDRNIRLAITATVSDLISPGSAETEKVITIDITNIGLRTATVVSIFWQAGILKKQNFIMIYSDHPLSHNLPKEIKDGEKALIIHPMESFFATNRETFSEVFKKHFIKTKLRYFRVGTYTTTGKLVRCKVSKPLREIFLKELKNT
ncbi:MAG: hypothetical protein HN600_17980 [Bacteroidetes bacterium]|jgi:hypothetical protein|nr:hypothetical protein [Bacteroidota bacterium]